MRDPARIGGLGVATPRRRGCPSRADGVHEKEPVGNGGGQGGDFPPDKGL